MYVNDKLFRAEVKKQLFIKGWNYTDLANQIGCTRSYVAAFMKGQRNGSLIASKIAKALDIKI